MALSNDKIRFSASLKEEIYNCFRKEAEHRKMTDSEFLEFLIVDFLKFTKMNQEKKENLVLRTYLESQKNEAYTMMRVTYKENNTEEWDYWRTIALSIDKIIENYPDELIEIGEEK